MKLFGVQMNALNCGRALTILLMSIMVVHAKQAERNDKLILVDKLEAVIFGDEGTTVITKSDTEKLTLEGKPRTVPDIIFEKLVRMDATKYRIATDDDAIDRYLAMIMSDNKLSRSDVERMFNAAGYTFEEGRDQLATMLAVNSMIDFKVKSYLIVPETQIIAYYKEHPIEEEAAYRLQRIVVMSKKDVSADAIKEQLAKELKLGREVPGVKISTAFWIKQSEIATDKLFITSMKPGELSDPVNTSEGLELFKLMEKRERREAPLEDRYNEIAHELKKPLFDKRFEEYRKSLFDAASIVYF